MSDDKVVNIRSAGPTARLKEPGTERAGICLHHQIEIWRSEPIIECSACGAVVEPYQWLRNTVGKWERMLEPHKFAVEELKREAEELKKAVRLLRKEYKDDLEKRRSESAVAVLPPRRAGA